MANTCLDQWYSFRILTDLSGIIGTQCPSTYMASSRKWLGAIRDIAIAMPSTIKSLHWFERNWLDKVLCYYAWEEFYWQWKIGYDVLVCMGEVLKKSHTFVKIIISLKYSLFIRSGGPTFMWYTKIGSDRPRCDDRQKHTRTTLYTSHFAGLRSAACERFAFAWAALRASYLHYKIFIYNVYETIDNKIVRRNRIIKILMELN